MTPAGVKEELEPDPLGEVQGSGRVGAPAGPLAGLSSVPDEAAVDLDPPGPEVEARSPANVFAASLTWCLNG
jgi:hypothetical protein